MQRILILNGSLGGSSGNTAAAIELLTPLLSRSAQVETVHLKNILAVELLNEKIRSADGFVFTSGTYWDSWGSPLQSCLAYKVSSRRSAYLFLP
jgi:NAD(P)H-dependent FMN reductase